MPNDIQNVWQGKLKEARKFLKNRIAWIQELTVGNGHYYYGQTDELPNIIIEGVNNSGTATQALRRKKQFIEAEGFEDEATGLKKIDKANHTFNDLLGEIAENLVKLEGFALRLYFNSEGEIAAIKNVPITWVRRRDDYTFAINRLMGERNYNSSQDVLIHEFDPSENPSERLRRIKAETKKNKGKQIGELYYCFEPKLGRNYDIYPVPSFYSGFDDIISDGKISSLEMNNIVQGWRAPIVISTGQIDNVTEDENGLTDLDKFNENVSEFLGEDASPVMHLQGRTPEEQPTVTTLSMTDVVDMTENATTRVGEKVCRLVGVPPVLCGFAKEGQLGNVQELENTMRLFVLSIKEWQGFITRKLEQLKPFIMDGESLDFTISNLQPFDFLPDKVIDRLTDAELRDMFELPMIEVSEGIEQPIARAEGATVNEHIKSLTGRQMQHIDRVVRKYNKEQLNETQAVIQLVSGFGFTEDEAKQYLGIEDGNDNTD
jgi:hypothetical protein